MAGNFGCRRDLTGNHQIYALTRQAESIFQAELKNIVRPMKVIVHFMRYVVSFSMFLTPNLCPCSLESVDKPM
jgi:hypothetical protein